MPKGRLIKIAKKDGMEILIFRDQDHICEFYYIVRDGVEIPRFSSLSDLLDFFTDPPEKP